MDPQRNKNRIAFNPKLQFFGEHCYNSIFMCIEFYISSLKNYTHESIYTIVYYFKFQIV